VSPINATLFSVASHFAQLTNENGVACRVKKTFFAGAHSKNKNEGDTRHHFRLVNGGKSLRQKMASHCYATLSDTIARLAGAA
jgi:hypothetical protein